MIENNEASRSFQDEIVEILKTKRTVSFEFFPPKSKDGMAAVYRAMERLRAFEPDFVSVTYGAGGSTRAFTEELATGAKNRLGLTVMAHLTCVGQTREEIHSVLSRLQTTGIKNIIALRGDPPKGETGFVPAEGGFAHATELIEYIKSNFNFGIAGACYPEGHQESPSLDQDIEYAKQKVDLGADFLITQLFYDNADFYKFLNKARQAGISVPIIAGLLPFLSAIQIRRITAMCGSKIPVGLDRRLEKLGEDDDAVRELGIEYTTEQVHDLWYNGVEGVHFYVLNRSRSVSRILENLSLYRSACSKPIQSS